jgi:multicomponent Na+:H+ antiporter subunit E
MFGHVLVNVVLALIWCFLVEDFTAPALIVGYVIGMGVMFVSRRLMGEVVFFHKLGVFLKLVAVFTRELLVANVQVAWWILRPRLQVQPALIQVPIDLQTDAAITALAGMISLTPGTVTVDVAPDRKSLSVHCLNVPDIAATKRSIKELFEQPLRELER